MAERFLVHCHIPKTGGSALNRRLILPGFGEGAVQRLYRYVFECAAVLPVRHRGRAMRSFAAAGHVPFGYFAPVYPGALHVSVFREPVERFVSFLNYVFANHEHSARRRLPGPVVDGAADDPDRFALAILDEPRLAVVHGNVQTRLASGLPRRGEAPVEAGDLARALSNLDRPDYLWGAQEDLDGFIARLAGVLEAGGRRVTTAADVPDRLAKRLGRRFAATDLAPATLCRITDANRLDMDLYDRVLRDLPPGRLAA